MPHTDHCKHQGIDRGPQIDLSRLKIHLPRENRTYTLYNKEAPGLHNAGAVERYLSNHGKSIVLIYPEEQETQSVNKAH